MIGQSQEWAENRGHTNSAQQPSAPVIGQDRAGDLSWPNQNVTHKFCYRAEGRQLYFWILTEQILQAFCYHCWKPKDRANTEVSEAQSITEQWSRNPNLLVLKRGHTASFSWFCFVFFNVKHLINLLTLITVFFALRGS